VCRCWRPQPRHHSISALPTTDAKDPVPSHRVLSETIKFQRTVNAPCPVSAGPRVQWHLPSVRDRLRRSLALWLKGIFLAHNSRQDSVAATREACGRFKPVCRELRELPAKGVGSSRLIGGGHEPGCVGTRGMAVAVATLSGPVEPDADPLARSSSAGQRQRPGKILWRPKPRVRGARGLQTMAGAQLPCLQAVSSVCT